jgi:hypothetical protein
LILKLREGACICVLRLGRAVLWSNRRMIRTGGIGAERLAL